MRMLQMLVMPLLVSSLVTGMHVLNGQKGWPFSPLSCPVNCIAKFE